MAPRWLKVSQETRAAPNHLDRKPRILAEVDPVHAENVVAELLGRARIAPRQDHLRREVLREEDRLRLFALAQTGAFPSLSDMPSTGESEPMPPLRTVAFPVMAESARRSHV